MSFNNRLDRIEQSIKPLTRIETEKDGNTERVVLHRDGRLPLTVKILRGVSLDDL